MSDAAQAPDRRASDWARHRRAIDRSVNAAWLVLGLLLVAGALAWGANGGAPYLLAMAIGGGVGIVELVGRYRYAPTRAVMSSGGAVYIAINVLASAAAYYLINVFDYLGAPPPYAGKTQVEAILLAGFGALVFLRSSVFKVKVGESDVGIGPAALLDTLLLVADRGVDRRQAVARAQDVAAMLDSVSDPTAVASMLAKYSLALMQNVDDRTIAEVGKAVNETLADKTIPDSVKIDIVALRLGVVVGADVLEAAVQAPSARLSKAPTAPVVAKVETAPLSGVASPAADVTAALRSELMAAGVKSSAPEPPSANPGS